MFEIELTTAQRLAFVQGLGEEQCFTSLLSETLTLNTIPSKLIRLKIPRKRSRRFLSCYRKKTPEARLRRCTERCPRNCGICGLSTMSRRELSADYCRALEEIPVIWTHSRMITRLLLIMLARLGLRDADAALLRIVGGWHYFFIAYRRKALN